MTAHADPNRAILDSILQKGEIDSGDLQDGAQIVDSLSPEERVKLAVFVMTSPLQSMARKDRLAAFQLAKSALEEIDEEQLPATSDFLLKFVAGIDGERDPRCLLETLPLHTRVCSLLGAENINSADSTMLEELFDVVSCYFPVTYTPPASEKNPVQKPDLKEAVLNSCCLPMFNEHAITFALDKVQSPVGEVKVDSLEMIERCCKGYPPQLLEGHISDIWSQIRTETLQAEVRSDSHILKAIFSLVRSLTTVICNYSTLDLIHSYLNPLLEGVLNMASLPTGFTTAKGYSALMYHICGTHASSLSVVVTRLLPLLSGAFSETQDENRRSSIISVYNSILGGAVELRNGSGDFELQIPEFVPSSVLETVKKGAEPETLVLCSEALSSLLLLNGEAKTDYVTALIKLCLDVTQAQANKQVLMSVSRVLSSGNKLSTDVVKKLVPALIEAPEFDLVRVEGVAAAVGSASEGSLITLVRELLPHAATSSSLFDAVLTSLRGVALEKKYRFSEGLTTNEFLQVANVRSLEGNLDFVFSTLQLPDQLEYINTIRDDWSALCHIGCGLRSGYEALLPTEFTEPHLTESEAFFLSSQLNKCSNPTTIIEKFLNPDSQGPHRGILLKGLLTRGGTFSNQAMPLLKMMTDSKSVKCVFDNSKKLSGMHHKNALLWRQKAYSCIYPALIEKYKEGGEKGSILESILTALGSASKTDVEAAGETLVPILIDFLGSEDAKKDGNTTQSAIELLLTFMAQCPSCISTAPVLGKLSPILLQAASSSPFKAVRSSSLRLLSLFASTPDTKIIAVTIKHLVLPGIKRALSDHKRNVREAAAAASNSWHMLV